MTTLRVYANISVPDNAGKVCLQRGPLIYCLEEQDNGNQLWNCQLPQNAAIQEQYESELFGGVVTLKASGKIVENSDESLYRYNHKPESKDKDLMFIPYYTWANRETTRRRDGCLDS